MQLLVIFGGFLTLTHQPTLPGNCFRIAFSMTQRVVSDLNLDPYLQDGSKSLCYAPP